MNSSNLLTTKDLLHNSLQPLHTLLKLMCRFNSWPWKVCKLANYYLCLRLFNHFAIFLLWEVNDYVYSPIVRDHQYIMKRSAICHRVKSQKQTTIHTSLDYRRKPEYWTKPMQTGGQHAHSTQKGLRLDSNPILAVLTNAPPCHLHLIL